MPRQRSPVQALVRPQVVVPSAHEPQVGGRRTGFAGHLLPEAQAPLDGAEQPLDPPVLPGGEGRCPGVPDADESQDGSKQPRPARRLVVGAQNLRRAEPLEDLQQVA